MDNLYLIFSMLLGVVFGSFLNVVCSRSDWYKGRSRCDSCGHTLAWYDLIPIISYTTLLGKCRYCKTKIKPTHLFAELLCMFAGACLYLGARDMALIDMICFILTGLVIGFNCVQDMNTQTVYVTPIYFCTVIVAILQAVNLFKHNDLTFALVCSTIFILYIICCYCLEKLARNFVGEGDMEAYPLIFLTSPYFGAIMLLSTLLVFIKKSLQQHWYIYCYNYSLDHSEVIDSTDISAEESEEAENGIMNKRIAFFPIMYIGYLIFALILK